MSENRLRKEKEFHDERFGGHDQARVAAAKYYSIMQRPVALYRNLATQDCSSKQLLEMGCATGDQCKWWMDAGANVTGIDISSEAIARARFRWAGTSYETRSRYIEMNAEAMSFDDNSFDIVVGNGIIHHLDLETCYREIARVLKPGGRAVFMEPLGHNPLINLYRRLTPKMRTEDEHPLKEKDFELARQYFKVVDCTQFHLSSLLAVPLRNTRLFEPVLNYLCGVDKALFRLRILRKQAWFVVLLLQTDAAPELRHIRD